MWHVLDTSSAVTVSSSPLFSPDNTPGISLTQTLNTMALYHSTFGRFEAPSCKVTSVGLFHHLYYSLQNYYLPMFCFSAHVWGVGHFKALHFQTADIFIKCTHVSIYHLLPNDI